MALLYVFCDKILVLNRESWPPEVAAPWLDGEQKMKKLCHRLNIDYNKARSGLRDFIDEKRRTISGRSCGIQICHWEIPVTSADAERGFSAMNNISSPLRNRLGVDRLANLIFVSLIGPPISKFNALPYVKKWLASGHRGAFETKSKKLQQKTSDQYSHICKVFQAGV